MQTAPDPRTIDILNRIKSVFAQKGFDGASMQDLSRAAGMSVGNFYRYFSSKNAIIEAMVALDLGKVGEIFSQILAAPDPRAALLAGFRDELEARRAACDGPLWAEIEAASQRRPEICAIHGKIEEEVRRYLIRVFAKIDGISETEAERCHGCNAALILILFKGIAIHPQASPQLIDAAVSVLGGLIPPGPKDIADPRI